LIRTAAEIASVPWFAIGGIDPENVSEVLDSGARRVCVVRAIRDAPDPAETAQQLADAIDAAVKGEG
jgi:thiamine-phosphate pyrophosphorylase